MIPISSTRSLRGLFTLLFVLWLPLANAMLPGTLGYQAYVTDNTGAPVNGEPLITFRLYTTETGASMVWEEMQRLTVQQGLLNAQLGAVTPFNLPDDFDTPLYLGIEVNTDGEMTPRQPLTLGGYAVQAANADTLDGQDADALDQSAHVVDSSNPHRVSAAQIGAATPADIGEHAAIADVHHARYTNAEAVAAVQSHDGAGVNADTLDGSDSTAFAPTSHAHPHSHDAIYYTQRQVDLIVDALQTRIEQLEEKLAKVTVSRDGNQIYVTAANLHLRSGSGATDGSINGLGNLIVGYDEQRSAAFSPSCSLGEYETQNDCETNGGIWASSHKGGSHNVVVGELHNYSRYGGLVAGWANTINGTYASVSGGRLNTASALYASVSGGSSNTASARYASVSGGAQNIASGASASVSGGVQNTASAIMASVSGGSNNVASGNNASVNGGKNNVASGENAAVSGGDTNIASSTESTVSGGAENQAIANNSTVGGGARRSATGQNDWVAGALLQSD